MPKFVRPTLQTRFHIDFSWWEASGQNLHAALLDQLCDEYRPLVEENPEIKTMDWVDPESAQVFAIDQLWHVVRTQCGQKPEFLAEELPLVTSVFRLFIANNNTPLTPVEMHQRIRKRSASVILRTIAGRKVYRGIRPVTPLIS